MVQVHKHVYIKSFLIQHNKLLLNHLYYPRYNRDFVILTIENNRTTFPENNHKKRQ